MVFMNMTGAPSGPSGSKARPRDEVVEINRILHAAQKWP